MKHYFFKGLIFAYPYEEIFDNFDWLSTAQEDFLELHPKAQVHEVRSCVMDVDKPVDIEGRRRSAKQQINNIASLLILQQQDSDRVLIARRDALQAIIEAASVEDINLIVSNFGNE